MMDLMYNSHPSFSQVHNEVTLGWLLLQCDKEGEWPTEGQEVKRLTDVIACLDSALQVAEDRWLEHEKSLIEHGKLAQSIREVGIYGNNTYQKQHHFLETPIY